MSGCCYPTAVSSHPIHLHRVDAAGTSAPSHLALPPFPLHRSNASLFYQFNGFSGEKLYLNLTRSPEWISGDISVEVVNEDGSSSVHAPQANSGCHFNGQVHRAAGTEKEGGSWAALSGCDGRLVSLGVCSENGGRGGKGQVLIHLK